MYIPQLAVGAIALSVVNYARLQVPVPAHSFERSCYGGGFARLTGAAFSILGHLIEADRGVGV
jgi:hypothetical protein